MYKSSTRICSDSRAVPPLEHSRLIRIFWQPHLHSILCYLANLSMSVTSVHHASGLGSAAYIEELEMNVVPQKTDGSQSVHTINEPSRNLSQASFKLSQTKSQRKWTNVQFASCCFSLFLAGWNDGTTGPLLPRIQEDYHVRTQAAHFSAKCDC